MVENPLTELQVEVLRIFFSLPESDGFMLAGGAGLVAVGLSEPHRGSRSLHESRVGRAGSGRAGGGAAASLLAGGQDSRHADVRRLAVTAHDHAEVLVDLARDSGPLDAPTITSFGPTYPAVRARGAQVARAVRTRCAA